jgi:uncharacterized damage-inducible protein DinB
MKRFALSAAVVLSALATTAPARAQTSGPTEDHRNMNRLSQAVKAREYAFKPTADVRSFGELIGHIADSQNFFCGVAAGANPEYSDALEKAKTPKTARVAALKASMSACDETYATTTAANALEVVKAGKGDALRGMMLLDNISHDNEHYGNIVTYMRLKGHVPPSTARTQTHGQ